MTLDLSRQEICLLFYPLRCKVFSHYEFIKHETQQSRAFLSRCLCLSRMRREKRDLFSYWVFADLVSTPLAPAHSAFSQSTISCAPLAWTAHLPTSQKYSLTMATFRPPAFKLYCLPSLYFCFSSLGCSFPFNSQGNTFPNGTQQPRLPSPIMLAHLSTKSTSQAS